MGSSLIGFRGGVAFVAITDVALEPVPELAQLLQLADTLQDGFGTLVELAIVDEHGKVNALREFAGQGGAGGHCHGLRPDGETLQFLGQRRAPGTVLATVKGYHADVCTVFIDSATDVCPEPLNLYAIAHARLAQTVCGPAVRFARRFLRLTMRGAGHQRITEDMMDRWPSREEADRILKEWTKSRNLRKHAYAVEAAMRAYAEKLGGDPDRWGVVGLLHDFDYERFNTLQDHPFKGVQWLREHGYHDDLCRAILAHAEHTAEPLDSPLKKAIFAVDELTGLIVAVALVRPSKKIRDVEVDSVLKKWDEQRFAAGVDRQQIERGAEELAVSLRGHVDTVLEAMKSIADRLGL